MNDERPRAIGLAVSEREARLWRVFMTALAVATCLAAILGVKSVYDEAAAGHGYDFYQFWLGGDVLRAHVADGKHGVLDLYTNESHFKIGRQYLEQAQSKSRRQQAAAADRKVVDTASSPFFYWVFSILTPGDYDQVYNAYIVFSLTCMVGTIAALAWRLRYSVAGIGAAITLVSICAPVYVDFNVINFNFPELAVCFCYLLLRGRARNQGRFAMAWLVAAGAVMGLLAAFKPNLVLLPALLGVSGLVSGRWRGVLAEAGGFAIAAVGAVAVSSWAFGGASCWVAWGRIVLDLGSKPTMPSLYGNFSPTRNIFEATGMNLISLFTAVGLVLATMAIWLGRRPASRRAIVPCSGTSLSGGQSFTNGDGDAFDRAFEFRHDLAVFGIAVAVTLLTSGLAWVHYPILLFPFLLLVGSRSGLGRIGVVSEIARYALLSIVVVLLMYPPLPEIGRMLPFRIEGDIRTWIRCSQAAVAITLGLGLWFEARLLGKEAVESGRLRPRTFSSSIRAR